MNCVEKLQKTNEQLQQNREKHYEEIQKLGERYEDKLQRVTEISEKDRTPTVQPELTKFFEKQVEENRELKKAIQQLMNQKGDGGEKDFENDIKQLEKNLEAITTRCTKYEAKYKEAKTYYRLFKQCSLVQCKYCSKYYKPNIFKTHVQSWALTHIIPEQNEFITNIEISITQTLIREDENIKKPFTMYVIESNLGEDTWTVQRKYKEFWILNEKLVRHFPNVELPSSAGQFFNKSLEDFYKKRKTVMIEQRSKNLQNYLNDISKIQDLAESQYFTEFIGYK